MKSRLFNNITYGLSTLRDVHGKAGAGGKLLILSNEVGRLHQDVGRRSIASRPPLHTPHILLALNPCLYVGLLVSIMLMHCIFPYNSRFVSYQKHAANVIGTLLQFFLSSSAFLADAKQT